MIRQKQMIKPPISGWPKSFSNSFAKLVFGVFLMVGASAINVGAQTKNNPDQLQVKIDQSSLLPHQKTLMDKTKQINQLVSRELKTASDALFKNNPSRSELRANQRTVDIIGARQTIIKIARNALGIDLKLHQLQRAGSIDESRSTNVRLILARHSPLIDELLTTASAKHFDIRTYNRQITRLRNSTFLTDMKLAKNMLSKR